MACLQNGNVTEGGGGRGSVPSILDGVLYINGNSQQITFME